MCDTAECQAANEQECKAEFYCYVSFRPARPSERKSSGTSNMMYGAGSQLYIAQHRGCVQPDQLEGCQDQVKNGGGIASGGFGNLNADEDGHSRLPVVRCCRDNWCNIDQVSYSIPSHYPLLYAVLELMLVLLEVKLIGCWRAGAFSNIV